MSKSPRPSNPWSKTAKVSDPHIQLSSSGWSWSVLRLYKSPASSLRDPFSRAFCSVTSPICPDGELGDVYVKDIPGLIPVLRQFVDSEAVILRL